MSHTSYQSDPDVWLEDHPAASFWQWLITRAVTEQTLSLTILRLKLYLFSYFDLWWFNHKYGGTWVPPNHRNHVVFGSKVNPPAAMGSQHLSNHVINSAGTFDSDQLGGFLATFFSCETWGADVFKRAFFWAMFFSRNLWNTRSGKKRELCWSSGHQKYKIEVSRSAKIAQSQPLTPQGSSLTKDSPEFTDATYASPRMSSIVGNLNLVLVIALSTAWLHELVTPSQTLGYLGLETALDDLGYIDHGERMIWGVLKMGDPQVTMFNMFPSSNGNCLGMKSGG